MTDQEINLAVARKLGHPDGKVHTRPLHLPLSKTTMVTGSYTPSYCTRIEAAWEVVEHMSKNSWIMMLEQHGLGLPHYAVRFSKIPYSDEMTSHASAATAPMAICRAFLKLP